MRCRDSGSGSVSAGQLESREKGMPSLHAARGTLGSAAVMMRRGCKGIWSVFASVLSAVRIYFVGVRTIVRLISLLYLRPSAQYVPALES